jgi:hypothetical protein
MKKKSNKRPPDLSINHFVNINKKVIGFGGTSKNTIVITYFF